MVVTDVSQLEIHLLREGGLCPLTLSQVTDTRARVKGKRRSIALC